MQRVQRAIDEQQRRVSALPFLRRLEQGEASVKEARNFARGLTFWVMTFQDVLHLNLARVTDPELQRLARQHLEEDVGHERWFWHDARVLDAVAPPEWYFGKEHALARSISFEVVSEVYRAESDEERIALLLALEGTGAVFFPRVIAYLERSGCDAKLKYFARSHHEIEQGHDLFGGETNDLFERLELVEPTLGRSIDVVQRVFAALGRLSVFLEESLEQARDAGAAPHLGPYLAAARAEGLVVEAESAEDFGTDFGHIVRRLAGPIVRARQAEDVQRAIALANQLGVELTPRGGGNSQSGQSVPSRGLTLHLAGMAGVTVNREQQIAICGPGTTWRQVLAASLPLELVPKVVPLNQDVTLGGSLSAGGFGSSSHRDLTAANHVAELTAVTGAGDLVVCSATQNAALFDAVLANQGQCAVATEIKIHLRKARPEVHTLALRYSMLNDLLTDMTWLAEHAPPDYMDAFCAASFLGIRRGPQGYLPMRQWVFTLHLSFEQTEEPELERIMAPLHSTDVVKREQDTLGSFLARFDSRFAFMRKTGAWDQPHPWLECVLPAESAAEGIGAALERMSPLLGDGHRLFSIPSGPYPKFFSVPKASSLIGFAVLPVGISEREREPAVAAIDALSSQLLDQGAKRYLSGWLGQPSRAFWTRHFGESYPAWRDAKRRFDPNGVLGSVLFSTAGDE